MPSFFAAAVTFPFVAASACIPFIRRLDRVSPMSPERFRGWIAECRLDFRAPFCLARSVHADDDATSSTALGGNAQNGAAAFATTHWSVVLEATRSDSIGRVACERKT